MKHLKVIGGYEALKIYGIIRYFYFAIVCVFASIYTTMKDVAFHDIIFIPATVLFLFGGYCSYRHLVLIERRILSVFIYFAILTLLSNIVLYFFKHPTFNFICFILIELDLLIWASYRKTQVNKIIEDAKYVDEMEKRRKDGLKNG